MCWAGGGGGLHTQPSEAGTLVAESITWPGHSPEVHSDGEQGRVCPSAHVPLPLSLCPCPSVRPLRLRALQQEARPAAHAPEAGSFPPEGACGGPCTSLRARFSHAAFPVPDTQQVRAQEHTPGARRLRARRGAGCWLPGWGRGGRSGHWPRGRAGRVSPGPAPGLPLPPKERRG